MATQRRVMNEQKGSSVGDQRIGETMAGTSWNQIWLDFRGKTHR